jgi:HEAT repeat protein
MQDFEALGGKLQSADAEERREAAVDLGRAGIQAVPLLLRAMADKDWRVRKTAVEALVAIAGESVITGLIEALKTEDNAGARNSAIEALVLIGGPALESLLPLLTTPDPDVRKFVVDILGDTKDSRAVPALITRLVEDTDENIRVAAAEALGKIRDPRAVDALLTCLNRPNPDWLDYAAAEALGQIGDHRALGPLLAALEQNSLREPVLEALG